jgi:hypothetical protein
MSGRGARLLKRAALAAAAAVVGVAIATPVRCLAAQA